jgi:pyridoxine kinase
MPYKKILTIQDISCVGQCSLTVALPILSACGMETCILPSAVLSTHTAGFTDFTVRDLTEDIPAIAAHWRKENISFDAIYTGYLGSLTQIDYVREIFVTLKKEGGTIIVDPAMGDNGKLYPAFDLEYVNGMKNLVAVADVVVPNLTEACFLTGIEYKTEYDEEYILTVVKALAGL